MSEIVPIKLSGGRGEGLVTFVDEEDYEVEKAYKHYLSPSGYVINAQSGFLLKLRENSLPTESLLSRRIAARAGLDLVGKVVHHIDGDPLNNTRKNLQAVTTLENIRYKFDDRVSKYRGVRQGDGATWNVVYAGRIVGNFEDELQAAYLFNCYVKKYEKESRWCDRLNPVNRPEEWAELPTLKEITMREKSVMYEHLPDGKSKILLGKSGVWTIIDTIKLNVILEEGYTLYLNKGIDTQYVDIWFGRKDTTRLSRWLLNLKRDELQLYADHIDGNPLNNTMENLRRLTPLQNAQNRLKTPGTTSSYIGVHLLGKIWVARLWCDFRSFHIGCFDSEVHAANARDWKVRCMQQSDDAMHKLNFPKVVWTEDEVNNARTRIVQEHTYKNVYQRNDTGKWRTFIDTVGGRIRVPGAHDTEVIAALQRELFARKVGIDPVTYNFPELDVPELTDLLENELATTIIDKKRPADVDGVRSHHDGKFSYRIVLNSEEQLKYGKTELSKSGFRTNEEAAYERNKMLEDEKLSANVSLPGEGHVRKKVKKSKREFSITTDGQQEGDCVVEFVNRRCKNIVTFIMDLQLAQLIAGQGWSFTESVGRIFVTRGQGNKIPLTRLVMGGCEQCCELWPDSFPIRMGKKDLVVHTSEQNNYRVQDLKVTNMSEIKLNNGKKTSLSGASKKGKYWVATFKGIGQGKYKTQEAACMKYDMCRVEDGLEPVNFKHEEIDPIMVEENFVPPEVKTSQYRGISFEDKTGTYRGHVQKKKTPRFKTEREALVAREQFILDNALQEDLLNFPGGVVPEEL